MQAKETVLVIDDELGPRESIKMVFQDKYRIYLARMGEEGLKILKENNVDTVILDIRMPRLNGLKVMEKIKETDPLLPVILLTGYGSLSTAQEAIRLGAFDYLSKPFDVDEIRKVVESALEKRRIDLRAGNYMENLRKLNRELKRELLKSDRLAKAGKISAAFYHETRNALTSVAMSSKLFLDLFQVEKERGQSLDKELGSLLSIIDKETERCLRMAKKYLEFSTLKVEEMGRTNLNNLLSEVLELIALQAKKKGVAIKQRLDPSLPAVTCQPDMIKQVFINIALNAVDALSSRGLLTVTSRFIERKQGVNTDPGNYVEVVFQDNGRGIPDQEIKHIFQPYFSSKGKKEERVGLGLSITKQIVEDHGGKIEVKSKLGQGTSMKVTFPIEYRGFVFRLRSRGLQRKMLP